MKKKHLAPLDLVHKLSMAIADAVELEEVYQLVLDQVVELLGVDKASIMIFDENMGALKIVAAHGMDEKVMKKSFVRVGEGISGKVFASHEPLLITDVKTESLGSNRDRYKTNSLMSSPVTCVPMKMGVENLGVINVTDRSDGTAFTDDDLTLLTTISNQAASYLHVCRLSEKLRGSEKLEHQLEIARQIQFRLIPTLPPQIAGLDVAGRLNTADRVGGDYYDCFLAREKRPAFVIADVSGHSIGAAIIMAAFRSSVRAQQDSDYLPSTLVQRVNQILFEDLYQSEQFISMVYLQYLESRQLIQFTNAGHPPPLMWRGKERRFEWLSTEDSLLGIDSKFQFHEKKLVVSKGDVIVLYTDGITEAANVDGERFGADRLMACVRDAIGGTSAQIVDVLTETVSEFIEPNSPKDDITALVLKVK